MKQQLYLESELCRKKVNDAIRVIKNKIDVQDRQLERFRQVINLKFVKSTLIQVLFQGLVSYLVAVAVTYYTAYNFTAIMNE